MAQSGWGSLNHVHCCLFDVPQVLVIVGTMENAMGGQMAVHSEVRMVG